ncbi:Caffeic acid 3-O-methyltransferase [Apostasia shenzhenica]|uniref:Caffeic acid 3-O-methyltransferase n=1 Tax=Apostasia shenzhenica TaxID=1088818 RepID=A0A2I0AJP8_9ASPA|nr:Caffeic acid 3-O-methyltransferase [Apostasia shenzhenica]
MAAPVLASMAVPRPCIVLPMSSAASRDGIVPVSAAAGRWRSGMLPGFSGLRASVSREMLKPASMVIRRAKVVCEAQDTTVEVPDVTEETWQSLVMECDKTVLVEFWAPWCEPCSTIHPVIGSVSAAYAGMIKCFKINTDENPEITAKYEIRSIPTVVIFKNGEKMEKVIGAVPESTLISFIEGYLDRNSYPSQPMETYKEEEEPFLRAMSLMSMSAIGTVVKAIIELGVLDIIAAAGPGAGISLQDIVAQLNTTKPIASADALERMLKFLVNYSILKCRDEVDDKGQSRRLYGLEPVYQFLLKSRDGMSLAPLLLHEQNLALTTAWHHLKVAVTEGDVPFDHVHGTNVNDHRVRHFDTLGRLFHQAMAENTAILMNKILETYKGFEEIAELLDVGGGYGATLALILSRYPHIKGINFDLPYVISEAKLIPGVEHVSGDMFISIPTAKTIFLKILKNCWKALPENGKVLIAEFVLPSVPKANLEAQVVHHIDLCMLAYTSGGKERTKEEFENLATEAGFTGLSITSTIVAFTIIELSK